MSAQRRTTVKEKTPAAPVATGKAAAPGRRETKPAPEKKAAAVEPRQSVIAARTQSVRTLFRDSWSEMKKVTWPDRETTRNLTLLVIAISAVLGLLLGGIDFILQQVFEFV